MEGEEEEEAFAEDAEGVGSIGAARTPLPRDVAPASTFMSMAPIGSVEAMREGLAMGASAFAGQCKIAESRASLGASERAAMFREGAAMVLCAGMAQYRTSPAAQVAALNCIRALATLSVGKDNCAELVSAGAIAMVVAALEAHGRNGDVQEVGCRTLLRFVLEPGSAARIVAAGGVSVIVAGMWAHAGACGMQEHGCWMLRNLAVDPANQAVVAAAGGIEAVVAAMHAHGASAPVLKAACQALWSLAVDPANQAAVGRAGGVEAIADALRAHPGNARLQESGCGALWNAACNAANALRAVHAGAVEALAEALLRHPSDAGVQWRACGAHAVLASSGRPEILRRQREAGVPSLARAALARFPSNEALQHEAKAALERASRVVLAGME